MTTPAPDQSQRPLCAVIALAAGAQQGRYKPYQEKLPDGVVDWDEGWIRADSSVPSAMTRASRPGRMEAQRVATVKGPGRSPENRAAGFLSTVSSGWRPSKPFEFASKGRRRRKDPVGRGLPG